MMINLCNDIIVCITRELSYPDLLKFTLLCKRFMLLQISNDFLKKKEKFHNPDKKFEIRDRDDEAQIYLDICINQTEIAHVYDYAAAYCFRACLLPSFFASLGYPEIKLPFKFPDILWKKIKYRFKRLDLTKIELNYHGDTEPCNDNYSLCCTDDYKYLIDQMKLLYYAFKYFKSEILKLL